MSYRDDMTRMARVEVVVDSADVPALRDLMTSAGVVGFTLVAGVAGLGHGGYRGGSSLFNDQDSQSLVLAVAPEERIETLVVGVRELLRERPGVIFVSDVYVSRPDHFR